MSGKNSQFVNGLTMKWTRLVVVLLSAGLLIGTANSKAQTDPALQVVYSHFIGTWSGTDEYRSDRGMITVPVAITIIETKNQKALKLDYVYSQKGKKDYQHLIRFMILDPVNGTVTLNWEHDSKEHYKATGLDEFMKTGYGTFGFSIETLSENGGPIVNSCTFQLTANTLSYTWGESWNPPTNLTTGSWKLSRVLPAQLPSR